MGDYKALDVFRLDCVGDVENGWHEIKEIGVLPFIVCADIEDLQSIVRSVIHYTHELFRCYKETDGSFTIERLEDGKPYFILRARRVGGKTHRLQMLGQPAKASRLVINPSSSVSFTEHADRQDETPTAHWRHR